MIFITKVGQIFFVSLSRLTFNPLMLLNDFDFLYETEEVSAYIALSCLEVTNTNINNR